MPRTLSSIAKEAIFASQTGEVFVLLLELEHASFADVIRVCSDNQIVTSRGYDYAPFPFSITLPDEDDDSPPQVKLRVDGVDRTIIYEVRRVTGDPITVRIYVVLASSPDTIEVGPLEFTLRDVEYDAISIEGTLLYEDLLNQSYPKDTFTPSKFPGLF